MAHILGIGIVTIDIINSVDGYPNEDQEVRATAQRITSGGNAANSMIILSQLGHSCSWAGCLTSDQQGRLAADRLADFKIDTQRAQLFDDGQMPTSYIALNIHNGSRSIIHYRDLPELDASTFIQSDLSNIDWLHFEGRNIDQTRLMLDYAAQNHPQIPRSIEIEKPREGITTLFERADLLIFSRHYIESCGQQPQAFLSQWHQQLPDTDLVCSWGEQGAYSMDRHGQLSYCPAYPPTRLIDTLGAGDTFNAGIINACLAQNNLAEALEQACKLAGRKCGHQGLDFIQNTNDL